MPKISTRVTFDKSKAVALIKAVSDDALTHMGRQAIEDANLYAPISGGDTQDGGGGDLKESAINHSSRKAEDGKFVLRWDTPYAQYLWHGDVMYGNPGNRSYGPKKLNFTSALAREEWAKYAREVHGEEWKKVYQTALRKGLQQ